MPVLPEDRVLGYLARCVKLSQALVPFLSAEGTSAVSAEVSAEFDRLISDLQEERAGDSRLGDESWNWIWKGKERYNYLQVYGRLAWVNLQLFGLL